MATPDFILTLREKIGNDLLWLTGVTAVVVRDEDVLLVERADNGLVTPVTGIVDPGEEPAITAVREVAEEAGIIAVAEALVAVKALDPMTYANGDRAQYLDIVFRLRAEGGIPHPADGENTRTWWCPVKELDAAGLNEDMRDRIRVALEHDGSARFSR
ncbi:NUDIX hydrolase [Microbacterium amylolyticum]|uniref:8-oxo-dGTP pyrophosphatase MutT (NUDIX family) n=1 Tax=Microbacterium amylolyticum TaxID=936337 RepID=A0ABS4ZMR7_9MICO|nr:NUDIX domain-containing protein [Microbacterium amylolyticum]MBP2437746.1 8-oxo-dGTP pyrophosphatase MutT (NUDIX family) [Microbacterium amylolyticum]